MQISGSPSMLTSALRTMANGEWSLSQATQRIASGNIDGLADGEFELMNARQTYSAGVKLAQVADEVWQSTIDILV